MGEGGSSISSWPCLATLDSADLRLDLGGYARLGLLEIGLRRTRLDLVRLETKLVSRPPSSVVLIIKRSEKEKYQPLLIKPKYYY